MGLLLSGKNPAAYKTVERVSLTATAGQTVFTVPNRYQVGDIDVFLNGIRLVDVEDYYANDGKNIVLLVAAAAGDHLLVTCYNNFLAAGHYTKTESDSRYLGVGGTTPMTSYLRTPNYGVTSTSDAFSASLEASAFSGEQGVGIKAFGRSVATNGGDLLYTTDSRGAGGRHRFGYWNGTSFTNTMTIDSLGRMTLPYQPLWVAAQEQTQAGPQSTARKMVWWGVIQNIGGHWNTTNNRFTCPVTGNYQVVMQGIKYPQQGPLHVDIYKNGADTGYYRARAEETATYCQYSVCATLLCNAGDYLEFYHFGDGGLHGGHGTFSIRLVQ